MTAEYKKCFAYQLGQYNGCRGASGDKFRTVCVHCPFWHMYKKRLLGKEEKQ